MHTKNILLSTYGLIILVIFALIPFHGLISVVGSVLVPDYSLVVKAWKEILLLIASVIAVILVIKTGTWRMLIKDKLLLLIGAYAVLHLILVGLFQLDATQAIAGLMIDLRYLLFFALVYVLVVLAHRYSGAVLRVSALSAAVIILFSILQITVLPIDFLANFGYGPDTIEPYLTIDKNTDYIRISSTLRGPNPLGAYMLIFMSVAAAYVLSKRNQPNANKVPYISSGVLLAVSPVVLWASYSRSALVAAIISILLVLAITIGNRLSVKQWVIALALPLLMAAVLLFAYRDSSFVQNVIVHSDPADTVQNNSNEGHIESLIDGTSRALAQPFGAGPGSTGSASLLSDTPHIIENQYLFIAHEAGWLGLVIFLATLFIILKRLWDRRNDWLSVGVLASGIGLSLIGLLLPVWADDTVSLVWWGLAGVALGSYRHKNSGNYDKISLRSKHEQKSNKTQ